MSFGAMGAPENADAAFIEPHTEPAHLSASEALKALRVVARLEHGYVNELKQLAVSAILSPPGPFRGYCVLPAGSLPFTAKVLWIWRADTQEFGRFRLKDLGAGVFPAGRIDRGAT